MFESTWYRCSKLSNSMPERYPSMQLMEEAALPHVLAWLGLRRAPGARGEGASRKVAHAGCSPPLAPRSSARATLTSRTRLHREEQLPRPGKSVGFDGLVAVLDAANASARLVSDPLPFLATQRVPTDRCARERGVSVG